MAKHKLKGRVESLNVFMREGERERDFLTDSSIASASTHLRVAKCGLRDEWFSLPGRCCAITPGVRERAGPHVVKQKCRRPWARPVVCFYQSCVRQLHPAKSLPLPSPPSPSPIAGTRTCFSSCRIVSRGCRPETPCREQPRAPAPSNTSEAKLLCCAR